MLTKHSLIKALSFTTFFFGFSGGMYIVVNSLVHPETLSWPLTHLTLWIREDTFGIISFIVSFVSFFIWNLIRYSEKN